MIKGLRRGKPLLLHILLSRAYTACRLLERILVGLLAAVSIPLSLWLPTLAGRRDDHRSLLWAVLACYPVAYTGLIVAPNSLAVLWAAFTMFMLVRWGFLRHRVRGDAWLVTGASR